MNKRLLGIIAAFVFLSEAWAVDAMLTQTDEPNNKQDDWRFTPAIYLQVAGIGATTSAGGNTDVSFNDLLDNLNFGIMGAFEVRKSKWWVNADLS